MERTGEIGRQVGQSLTGSDRVGQNYFLEGMSLQGEGKKRGCRPKSAASVASCKKEGIIYLSRCS